MALGAFALFAALFALAAPLPARAQDKPPLLVFAAASLKNALDEIATAWTRGSGVAVRISYASSSALAKQIEQGAPADLFLSADRDWMDYIDAKKLVRAGTRHDLLGNSIVLIAPKDGATANVTIAPGFPLASLLGGGRLAVAGTATVPAGKYAKAALEKLGVWAAVEQRLAEAENVRAALAFVARGETPLGVVYATDAAAEPSVKIVGRFPPDSHPAIVYPMAILAESKNPAAEGFRRHLAGPEAKAIFERHGFTVFAPPRSS
ncbi:MAG TPA: molybdate ABC transporter substrate-binding protein [Alphaproteobacteria bacterium]